MMYVFSLCLQIMFDAGSMEGRQSSLWSHKNKFERGRTID